MTLNASRLYHEKQLIKDLKKGSDKAFNEIYFLYAKRLYAYCLRFTKLQEDAEEIVQDTFLKLWKNKLDIRQEETVQSLLFLIAKHLLINSYRIKSNYPVYEECAEHIESSSAYIPDYNIRYEDIYRIFQAGIESLPNTQQKVIKMSRLNNYSNKEIADKLSLSEQTIKNQLSIGLKTLEEYMNNIKLMPYTINSHS